MNFSTFSPSFIRSFYLRRFVAFFIEIKDMYLNGACLKRIQHNSVDLKMIDETIYVRSIFLLSLLRFEEKKHWHHFQYFESAVSMEVKMEIESGLQNMQINNFFRQFTQT